MLDSVYVYVVVVKDGDEDVLYSQPYLALGDAIESKEQLEQYFKGYKLEIITPTKWAKVGGDNQ